MTAHRPAVASLFGVAALVIGVRFFRVAFPDWFSVVRTVMMALGGVVVIAIVLVVAVAIISGVIGMVGNLRKPHD